MEVEDKKLLANKLMKWDLDCYVSTEEEFFYVDIDSTMLSISDWNPDVDKVQLAELWLKLTEIQKARILRDMLRDNNITPTYGPVYIATKFLTDISFVVNYIIKEFKK